MSEQTGLDEAAHAALVHEITNHPAWRGSDALAQAGLDFEVFRETREYHTDNAEDVAALAAYGLTVEGGPVPAANRARIFAKIGDKKVRFNMRIRGTRGMLIVVAPDSDARGGLNAGERDHLVVFGGGSATAQTLAMQLMGPECAVVFGRGASSFGMHLMLEGPSRHFVFGRGAMASEGIRVMASDNHTVISLDDGQVINEGGDVVVEPHVWLGLGSIITKNTRIGRGSVVATGSVITKDVPPCSAVAGVPAAVVRSNITWARAPAWKMAGKRWQPDENFQLSERTDPLPEPKPEPEPEPALAPAVEQVPSVAQAPALEPVVAAETVAPPLGHAALDTAHGAAAATAAELATAVALAEPSVQGNGHAPEHRDGAADESAPALATAAPEPVAEPLPGAAPAPWANPAPNPAPTPAPAPQRPGTTEPPSFREGFRLWGRRRP